MRLAERTETELFYAAETLSKITPTNAATLADAVGLIEAEIGRDGYAGIIHAPRHLIGKLRQFIVRQGAMLFTPGGHRWVFGSGYTALDNTLVGTGPVLIRRGEITTTPSVDHRHNRLVTVAERSIAVAHDGPAVAVSVPKEA